jgi:hypothetical protein
LLRKTFLTKQKASKGRTAQNESYKKLALSTSMAFAVSLLSTTHEQLAG